MKDKKAGNSPIQFPCEFEIKVMGRSGLEFESLVVGIVRKHVPSLGEAAVKLRHSKKTNYTSLSITIHAESREQLDAIYCELHEQKGVLMTL